MRLAFLFTLAACALAGCSADEMLNQTLLPNSRTPRVVCTDANPIHYAQTCGFYFGGHGSPH
jgi:hypothetical protein